MNDLKHANKPVALTVPGRPQPVSRPIYVGGGPANSDPDTVSNAWRAILRGKYLVLACVAGGLLLAVAVSGIQKPMYEARTILEVRDPTKTVSPFTPASAPVDAAADSTIVTEVTLLHSEPLIRSVVKTLKLDQQPGFAPATDSMQLMWRTLRREALPPETPLDHAVQAAQHGLSIRHQARIIELDYDSTDPVLAARFVNTLAEERLLQTSSGDANSVRKLREWLDQRTAEVGQKLARSESEMQRYAEGSGIVQTDSHDTVTQEQLRLLSEELGRAEADRMVKESRAGVASAAAADAMPQIVDDPVLRDYQTKLTDLRRQSQELQALLTPENYKVKQVENQIAVLEAAIKKELTDVRSRAQSEYRAAVDRENLLKSRFAAESQHVTAQEAKFIHYGTLQQELDTTRAMHAELLEKSQQLGLVSAAPNTDLRVVSEALPPTRPYTPNYPLNLSLGLFVGLFAGITAAVSREQLKPRLRAPGETSLLLQLPEFAAIPSVSHPRASHQIAPPSRLTKLDNRLELAAWNGAHELLNQSIQDALASIMSDCEHGSRAILFTSPSPGDGKTTISANLAISLAACRRRVLLIDGDLRRPRLHGIFNVPLDPGLSEALRDGGLQEGPEVEKVHELPIPNLFLMTSGRLPANHTPLLGGRRLAQIMNRMRSQYDVILIDAPPVLHGPDARLLGRVADSVILVTRARKTSHQDAIAAATRLAADKIPLTGTILNDWNPRSDSAAYGSYTPPEPETMLQ